MNPPQSEREKLVEHSYQDITNNRPFYILRPNQDITVWRKGEHSLQIYFHEGFWCNPPTNSHMGYDARKAIEKYGIAYLPDDYVEKYKQVSWDKKTEYTQQIANQILGERRTALTPKTTKTDPCEECGGDGLEHCNNTDHVFNVAIGGEIGRLGCPVCKYPESTLVINGGSCEFCNGTGETTKEDI